MRGPAQIASYIGTSMVLMGFLLIFLAWNGAADLDRIQGQFPFVLSGGLGGLGLIIAGMAVIAIQTQRTIIAERAQDMTRLQAEADLLLLAVAPEKASELQAAFEAAAAPPPPASTLARGDRPEAGYAPAPRRPGTASSEETAGVATMEAGDEAWAPPTTAAAEAERIAEALGNISGVGPTKQQLLQERFGTLEAISAATPSELEAVPGISATLAKRVYQALR